MGSGGTTKFAPLFRCYKSDGASLYHGNLVLGDGTGASGTWGISITGNANTATKSTQDDAGNNIKATYASSIGISDHTITLYNKNGTSLGTVTVPDNNTTYNFSGTTFYSGNGSNAEHNANNAIKNGNYYYTSNGPATSLGASTSDGALYTQAYNDSWVGQIAQDYRDGQLFVRGKNNGTWQAWYGIPKMSTSSVGGSNRGVYVNSSGDITAVDWYPNYVGLSSGNTNNWPWHRFATTNMGTGSWVDKDAIVFIRSRYNSGKYGIVKISARADNATTSPKGAVSVSATWIVRYGFAVDDVRIAKKGLAGESAQVDVYVKCGAYMRAIVYTENGSNNGWSLISSNEVSDTTTSDKKTSVEVYTDVSTTVGAITYDTVVNAVDGGQVNYANSAGSTSGNANSATALKDRTNSTLTYSNYGAAGLAASAVTWLTCWNGYELRAISKDEMANAVDGAHKWVRLTGDTMTGALNTANNTWNSIGDDVQIGDINEAGTLGIQGKNGNTALRFTTYNQTTKTTGGKLTWNGTVFQLSHRLDITGLLTSTANSNTVTIGSQNANFTHIYNSANIPFIFNNSIQTTTGNLGSNSYPFNNLYLGTANGAGIYYQGSKASYRMIRFIDNTSDAYGNGISIGGGGQTIIGGGESADIAAAQTGTTGSEVMYVCNDGDVTIMSNLQNGWDSRKTMTLNTSGYLMLPSYINSPTGNNENPTVSQFIVTNGSDHYYRKASTAHAMAAIRSSASGSWGISITGSAASATTASEAVHAASATYAASASSAGSATTANYSLFTGKGSHAAAVTANEFAPPVGTLTVVGNVSNTTMTHSNNANAEMIIKAHPTSGSSYYEARLGFSSNGNLYYMPVNGTTWNTIAYTNSDITGKSGSANYATSAAQAAHAASAAYAASAGSAGSATTASEAIHAASAAYAASAGSSTNASNLISNNRMDYGWNGMNYFNIAAANQSAAKVNDTPYSSSTWTHIIRLNHANNSGYYTDLAIPFNANDIYYKRVSGGTLQNSGNNGGWVKVLDELNFKDYADSAYRVGDTGNCTYVLATLNKEVGWMYAFTLRLYQSYTATDIQISGYNYGSNHWYSPQAIILGSTSTSGIKVYFGYTANYKLWVAVDGGNYTGASIFGLTNGYTQTDFSNAITLTKVSSLPGTTQTTITAYRPWHRNETVATSTYAVSAGSAGSSTHSNSAAYAASAGSAGSATSAGSASYAASAGSANSATTASQAVHAASAAYATSAGFATTASQAVHAASATYAASSGSATSAGSASYAATASTAGITTTANVAVSSWGTHTEAVFNNAGYTQRASIGITNCNINHYPIVSFSVADAISGVFSPVAQSAAGAVYIYARSVPTAATPVTIKLI